MHHYIPNVWHTVGAKKILFERLNYIQVEIYS